MSLNVFIADDEASLRQLIPAYLETVLAKAEPALPERNYTLANSGQEARAMLEKKRFDFVVLDGQMSKPSDERYNGPAIAVECVDNLNYLPGQVVVFSGHLGEHANALSASLRSHNVKLFDKPEIRPLAQHVSQYLTANAQAKA